MKPHEPFTIKLLYIAVASPEYYDDVYFDSDSSEGGGRADDDGAGLDADGESSEGEGLQQRKVGKKVRKLTNDELFYDPNMDEEDEKWVRRRRMAYHNGESLALLSLSLSLLLLADT